jgi:hypothetical protein
MIHCQFSSPDVLITKSHFFVINKHCMKNYFFSLLVTAVSLTVSAQTTKPKVLRKTLTLIMPRTDADDMPGRNGGSVAWNPLQKKYYAAMAGNFSYPLAVYDMDGKLLSPETLNCEVDVRGLWYNPVKKQVQGNAYADAGWFALKLDAKGIPESNDIIREGANQPGDNCVGAYNTATKEVLFLKDGYVSFYSFVDGMSNNSVQIQWGRTKNDPVINEGDEDVTPDNYNHTTVVYTGLKGAELGFLNNDNKQIELYSIDKGTMTTVLKLPEEAVVNSSFNFAYTNGMYWLYDIDKRVWTGYK